MRYPRPRAGWLWVILVLGAGALAGCSQSDAPDDELHPVRAAEIPRIVPAHEVLAGAHIPTLDPVTMNDAEIRKVLGPGPRCEFRYTRSGNPVLAVKAPTGEDPDDAVIKLNGRLVVLRATSADGEIVLLADDIRMTLTPEGGQGGGPDREADLVFAVGDALRAGYHGHYRCVE